jgi:hypothetical protein
VHVYGGSTEWEVTIEPAVGEMAVVASAWSLSVGVDGAILSGSGYLADPESVGDYPLAGVSAGLRRLQQGAPWTVYGGPGPVPMMGAAAANGSGAPTVTEPPATVRTITGVHLALGWWSAADPAIQAAWLLPVYVFELDNGQTVPVLAVSDRYLTQPASTTTPTTEAPAKGPAANPTLVPPPAPAPEAASAGAAGAHDPAALTGTAQR